MAASVVGATLASLYQTVILIMKPNPDPCEVLSVRHGERPVRDPYSRGPELAHFLEVQRRMRRIGLQQCEALVRQLALLLWQRRVELPESSCCSVLHRE